MKFYMPVKVWEEKECVAAHAAEMAAMGKRALLVTGKGSAERNGSLRDVTGALEENGCSWVRFSDVEENPSVGTIMKARDLGVREGCDVVIGIGGGSPMDAAKAVAMMIRHADEDWQYMYDAKAEASRLPLVLIPTTCGTGSEVTGVSVLTRHDVGKKGSIPHVIFGDLALLDGKYLKGMPARILANTTMDAFCHLTESYINSKASEYSRMCVDAGLKTWKLSKDAVLGDRQPLEADYANMLRASAFAGMSIAHTGTSLPHALSYALTYHLGMPHGKACGFFTAGYLREASEEDRSYILKTAGFADTEELEDYFVRTCGPCDVPEDVLEKSVRDVCGNPSKMKAAPFVTDEKLLRRMCGIG